MSASARRALPLGAALTLQDFLHRSRVLGLYRTFLRELRGLDEAAAREARTRIREGFMRHRGERDRSALRALLADGERELQFVRTYAGTARRASSADSDAAPSSWVGTGEAWDVRGRVGSGWAWEAAEPRIALGGRVSGMGPPRRTSGGQHERESVFVSTSGPPTNGDNK